MIDDQEVDRLCVAAWAAYEAYHQAASAEIDAIAAHLDGTDDAAEIVAGWTHAANDAYQAYDEAYCAYTGAYSVREYEASERS